MAFSEAYRRQVTFLVRTLPFIAAEPCFAMKGGTAINLFVRDLPRLSVDIDLTYLPIQAREASLAEIEAALKRITGRIAKGISEAQIQAGKSREGILTKLVVRGDTQPIKIEVTPVLRGSVFDAEVRTVVPAVEEAFGFAEIQIVSFPDLYAGKIVAALDRQHPRDLFDIRELLAEEGIDGALRQAFIVYLLSHNRPMGEVLASPQKDIAQEFERGFIGMTREPVKLEDLIAARKALVADIIGAMPDTHRAFLLSFERGEPDWALLGIDIAPRLPAIRWRQQNLDKLSRLARAKLVAELDKALSQ